MNTRRALRVWPLLVLTLALIAPSGPVAAADSGLDRLTRKEEQFGWEAVGRLDIEGAGFCTGALIAPDLVLTAAHCLYDNRTGTRYDPRKITFLAGYRDGTAVAMRKGRRAVVLDGYDYRGGSQLEQLQHDAALLQLAEPIQTAIAAPFAIGRRVDAGDNVSVVSYARDRAEALSWQRRCQVTGRGQGALAFSCDVYFGSSGAPVFESSSGRARIVSIVSRGTRSKGRMVAYGMEIAGPVQDLKAALRAGRGVFPKESFSARRVSAGTRNTQSGARFMRAK